MDEFIVTVLMEGDVKPTELINFGNSPEEVIDNIVQIKGVHYLFHIERIRDGEVWDFDAELSPLREIREMIMSNPDSGVALELNLKEIVNNSKKLH